MRIKLFAQELNSGIRLPSPVFSADEELGNDGGDQIEQQGGEPEKAPPSRFDNAGLLKHRSAEGEEEKEEEQPGDDKAQPGARPDHIPEKFWDAKTGQVRHDAMAKAYNDLETKLRGGGKIDPDDTVPEQPTVEAYFGDGIDLDESVDRLGLEMDDPGLKVAADVFSKYGIGKKTAAAIVKDMFKGMNEHAPAPLDPDEELRSLGPNGKAAIDSTYAWLNKLDREGKLNDDDADVLIGMMSTAKGVKTLNKLRGMTGEMAVPTGHHIPASGGMSQEEWTLAYSEAVEKKDYKKQEELDKISAGVFGNTQASGSPIRGLPGR